MLDLMHTRQAAASTGRPNSKQNATYTCALQGGGAWPELHSHAMVLQIWDQLVLCICRPPRCAVRPLIAKHMYNMIVKEPYSEAGCSCSSSTPLAISVWIL